MYTIIHNYSNGRIHTNIHLFIHVIQSLFFSLFFLCMLCENSQQQDLFPVLLLSIIAHSIDILFLHGIRAASLIKFYRVDERFQSPTLSKEELVQLTRFSPSLFCRLQRVSTRAYRKLQYGFKISSTISFQLFLLESQDERIIEEEVSL